MIKLLEQTLHAIGRLAAEEEDHASGPTGGAARGTRSESAPSSEGSARSLSDSLYALRDAMVPGKEAFRSAVEVAKQEHLSSISK